MLLPPTVFACLETAKGVQAMATVELPAGGMYPSLDNCFALLTLRLGIETGGVLLVRANDGINSLADVKEAKLALSSVSKVANGSVLASCFFPLLHAVFPDSCFL